MANLTLKTIFSAVDKMSGPIKTITGKVEKFNSTAGKVAKIGATLAKGAAIVGGAALAAGAAAGRAAIAFAERGDDIARNAAILGLSASAYQELAYAANMADVDIESFASASKKLNNNLGQLKAGTGALYSELSKSNPELAKQLKNAKNTDEAFALVAAAIAAETDVTRRAALAQAAFGRGGQELIPMMESLAAAREEARRSGSIIGDDEIAAASRLDDALKRIKAAASGPINQALAMIAGKMAPIIEKITEWISANRELIGQKLDEAFATIGRVAEAVGKIFATLAPLLKPLWDLIMALVPAFEFLAKIIEQVLGHVVGIVGAVVQGISSLLGGGNQGGPVASSGLVGDAVAQARAAGTGNAIAPAVSSSSSVARSELAVTFANPPAGMNAKQLGTAPGISVNMGPTLGGAW